MDATTDESAFRPKLLAGPAKSPTQWGRGPAPPKEARFLQGPQPRGFELMRALRIFCELLHGFRKLHFVGPCVTVFGSARLTADQPSLCVTVLEILRARRLASFCRLAFSGNKLRRCG